LDRLVAQRLGVGGPAHRHRLRARDIAINDRRADVAGTVALHPTVPGKGQTVELLAEVLDHVVALWLAVDQDVDPQFFLMSNYLADLLLEEGFIFLARNLALVEGTPGLADIGRLREGSNRGGRERRQFQPLALEGSPLGKR